ncbi:LacI family DNA-binding transcriptional regulator [Paenarthrobacter sp. 2TAF44]|uniref:LacI family DNA-binding transcriptional regulator n=1 Tax=Paenarthrobacter sp. 2TAF44 TaxID=3233018 RepID=UPI003F94DFF2
MVSIRDVAQHADVPIGTVSNYMNAPHRVAPETQKRIEKAINDLGNLRNEAAGSSEVASELGPVARRERRRAHSIGKGWGLPPLLLTRGLRPL